MAVNIQQMMLEAKADKILAAAGLDRNGRPHGEVVLQQAAFDYSVARYEPTQEEVDKTLENSLRRYK
ncbi:MAG: hypothetical protein KKD18_04090 [Nanoarchaeota archaeon]|nr:hypothetical protein [Nanoarchaeota archaeon]MBU0977571.1 hypothetical protein [Nanoarchaeota archaeon]